MSQQNSEDSEGSQTIPKSCPSQLGYWYVVDKEYLILECYIAATMLIWRMDQSKKRKFHWWPANTKPAWLTWFCSSSVLLLVVTSMICQCFHDLSLQISAWLFWIMWTNYKIMTYNSMDLCGAAATFLTSSKHPAPKGNLPVNSCWLQSLYNHF